LTIPKNAEGGVPYRIEIAPLNAHQFGPSDRDPANEKEISG
jgi:hypothetical protein